jgi:hypothetical protein
LASRSLEDHASPSCEGVSVDRCAGSRLRGCDTTGCGTPSRDRKVALEDRLPRQYIAELFSARVGASNPPAVSSEKTLPQPWRRTTWYNFVREGHMTDFEALMLFANGGKLTDQPTIRRLSRAGLITVDDITTLDSTDAKVLVPMCITERGQKAMTEANLRKMDNDSWNRAAPGHTGTPRTQPRRRPCGP